MKSKKVIYCLLAISGVLIISGGFASFVFGLKNDREETFRRVSDVNNEFETFSTNTSIFESFRDSLYNEVLGNCYYDTMYQNDASVKEKLKSYEKLVDEMENNTKTLKNLCEDVYYPDSKANSKCSNYKSIYEQVVNYFITDVKLYNENVKKYNDYQASLNSELRLDDYTTNKKYVDFNNDGKMDGKEE